MLEVWLDCILDMVKTIPILFVVYLAIGWMETRMDTVTRIVTSTEPAGPIIGALVGAIPQCGFSVGCSALYCRGFLPPATLIAVYLSTSDEAIPVLLAGGGNWKTVLELISVKLIVAILAGYLFYFTLFRKKWNPDELPDDEVDMDEVNMGCSCCNGQTIFGAAVSRTVSTTVFLLATMLILNTIIYLIGEDTVSSLLLGGTSSARAVRVDRSVPRLCRVRPADAAVPVGYDQLWRCHCRPVRRRRLWLCPAGARISAPPRCL